MGGHWAQDFGEISIASVPCERASFIADDADLRARASMLPVERDEIYVA